MSTKRETTPTAEKKTTVKKAPTERKPAVRKTRPVQEEGLQTTPAAEAKAATKTARKPAPEKSGPPVTRVMAYVDVGLGNTLFLRGEGPGLSWESGVPMQWTGEGCWSWSAEAGGEEITFKVLINDQHWSGGDNLKVASGGTASFTPAF